MVRRRMTATAAGRDISPLFSPTSVAVVGASDDPVKWGHWLAVRALRGERRRGVHLVNRRGGEVLGRPAYPSLADVPAGGADLVVLAVPSAHVEQGVRDAIAAGARAIVAITAGNDGEAGGAGDAALAALARDAGVALLGPNCLGVFDGAADLELVSNDLPRGSIGLISQSGQLSLEIGMLAEEAGLGFSRFVSLGNQADLEAADLVRELAGHDGTELIAVYAEDFRDGREFIAASREAAANGKPVVLMAIEHTEATARAVRSHTGALASDRATIDAACRAAGIERVASPQELVDLAQALLLAPPARGARVAILADGGGHGGIATSLVQAAGLAVPELSGALTTRLRAELPPTAAVTNPIDLAGGGEQDITSFDRTTAALLESGEADAVLLSGYFGGYEGYGAEMAAAELDVAAAIAASVARTGRPLVVHSMHPDTAAARALRAQGVPVYKTIDRAVAVLARLAGRARADRAGTLELPPPATPITADDYAASRALLADGGVPFAEAAIVTTADEAVAAARTIGYPVVVKALGLLHKSDAGGVVLGVAGDDALRATVADLHERLAPTGISVERMAPLADGVELIAGARRDARFGPMVLVGLGGVFAETLRDTAVALAPVSPAEAEALLLSLRGAALLQGVRGRPPVDVAAAAQAVAALSQVAAAHPEIAEIEVNPLLATPAGALGLDARIVRDR
jgi:acyl-CoA synthetase (NDP forming)